MEKTVITGYLKMSGVQLLLRLGLGALAGLILIQMLNFGWMMVAIFLVFMILLMISLDGYKAWIILLAASTFSGLMFSAGSYTIRPDQVALIYLMAGWLFALLAGKTRLYWIPLLVPAILYLIVNFLSSMLYAPNKGASYQGAFLLGIYIVMFMMTVLVLQEHPGKLKSAIKAILVISVIQALYALIALTGQSAGIDLGGTSEKHIENVASLQGGFEEPNLLGAFAAAMGLMFVSMLTGRKASIRPWLAVSGLLLMILVLSLSYTRAAWFGFFIGMILILFIQKPDRNIFNPRGAVVVIILVAAAGIIALSFASELASTSLAERASNILQFSTGSGEGRVEVQNVAVERWQHAQVLGYGTLSFPPELASPAPASSWLYSSVIQALHDTGAVGLGLLLWFQAGLVIIVYRSYKITKDQFYRSALAGFMIGSVALFIASQASSFLWLGFYWIYSGMAVATAMVASREAKGAHQQPVAQQMFAE
ncbi:MAG: O-antigen ligase family protein [Thermoleophilia bacterium]